ncbi:monooxygenase (secreted protein) [Alloactinosynnema sp. L-07]|uniref:FAD-dependent monooxygenase n=1 Tax=Alloactinosynnema sp. L-07 TaxID=1653480 RepID=UPI00065EF01F|nr:FAD-dependent monooxygenase [Alloactinosynnema sp. L-07]CRK61973.1 monooxygenase (secreted protein) [Alloactinosynnema sp. L-07]
MIHVVGAGIAGLASALALRAAGLPVRVVERASAPRAHGGGIGLTPNGMHALHRLGVGPEVCARSVVQTEGGVRTPGGRWLARSDLAFVPRRYGEHVRALLRRDLTTVLAAALPPGTVHYGLTAALVAPGGMDGPALLRVGDDVVPSDLVVAADGIRSALRGALYPDHPGLRDCGSASWRAVVPADGVTLAPAETWGAGLRLSILPLPAGRAHFSALATDAARANADLGTLFGRWHDPIPTLLARAAEAEVHLDRIEELAAPLPALDLGRVVLVGDAAHPMTPNVGLANVALEDAVELAHRIGDTADFAALRAALADYDRVRRPRVDRLARISRWTGRVVESSHPVAVAARNAGTWLGGLLPEVVSRRSLDTLVGWSPPEPAGVRPG